MKSLYHIREQNRTSESGAAFIEAALALLIFMFFLYMVILLLVDCYYYAAAQYSVTRGVRSAITSVHSSVTPDADGNINYVDNVENFIIDEMDRWGLTVTTADIHVCPFSSVSQDTNKTCGTEGAGEEHEFFSISVDVDHSKMIPITVYGIGEK